MGKILGIEKEEINIGRQPEIDIVKLIALVLMAVIHSFDEFFIGDEGLVYAFTYNFLDSVFCAPIFMCAMGAGIIYSRHNSSKDLIDRGIILLVSGWLLNIVRTLIDYDLLALLTGEKILLVGNVCSLQVDILGFSGCAYILTGLLKKLKLKETGILIIALVLSILGQLLIGVETGVFLIDSLLGYFWGTNTESYFPLFYWYIYVAGGMAFAAMLRRAPDKKKFYKPLIAIGAVAIIVRLVFNVFLIPEELNYFTIETSYTWVSPLNSVPELFVFMGYCGIVYLVTGGREYPRVRKTTENITRIFVIHWLIICTICLFMNLEILPWIESELLIVIVGIAIFIAAMLLAEGYRSALKPGVDAWLANKKTPVRVIIVVVTFAMAIAGILIHNKYFPLSEYPTFLNEYEFLPEDFGGIIRTLIEQGFSLLH